MRLNGKSCSEWAAVRRERSPILVVSVACAIGVTTSAALILSLGNFPIMQTGVPPISPRALVRNVSSTSQPTNIPKDAAVGESPLSSAVASIASMPDEVLTPSAAEHRGQMPSRQRQRQQRSRQPHWQGRSENGSWRLTRFNSRRDELTSGTR
jgi:hypothetical protein